MAPGRGGHSGLLQHARRFFSAMGRSVELLAFDFDRLGVYPRSATLPGWKKRADLVVATSPDAQGGKRTFAAK